MIARLATRSLIALVLVAAAVHADPPSMQEVAATAQSAAAGKRTVAVIATSTVTYPCDRFAVALVANSGIAAADEAQAKIDALAGRAQDALRIAALGVLQLDEHDRPLESNLAADGKIVVYRRYRVNVASIAAGRAVQACLVPLTSVSASQVSDEAKFDPSALESSSTKLDADPKAAEADARRQALANGRAEAEQTAKTLNMKLGPPVTIGVLSVTSGGESNDATERTLNASGVVVFEMTE